MEGKTLLIHEEQGFGDTILAARYIPLIQKSGGRVILECKPPLHRLFSKIPGLDALAEPAFLIDARGHLQHANREGVAWLERDRREVMERLARVAGGDTAGLRVTPLAGGGPAHLLVIAERVGDEHPRKVERFCERHRFTPREKQVLALVTRGEPNRRIANELCCSEKTVELHVTHLLRKCTVTSRTELVAAFWSH